MNVKEIKEKIAELQSKINESQRDADRYKAMQLALKLVINGEYGAMANTHFVFSNSQIANAITSMGREIINYMDQMNEKYWYTMWHVDYELHEKLKIERPRKLDKEKEPVSIYIDTDSLFVGFQPGMDSCNWDRDPLEFVMFR